MTVHINTQYNSIEVSFPQKPAKEMLSCLNQLGFKWSPSKKHWYTKDVGGSLVRWLADGNELSSSSLDIIKKTAAAADIKWLSDLLGKVRMDEDEVFEIKLSQESRKKIVALKTLKFSAPAKPKASKMEPSFDHDFVTMSGLEVYSEENDPYRDGAGLGKAVVNEDVYKMITDMVIKTIDTKKDLVWRKPWESVEKYGMAASNYVSKKAYRGANAFLLNFIAPLIRKKDWDNPYFLTFQQVEKLGGKVKKNAKGYVVTYFQMIYKNGNKKISEQMYWQYFARCAKGEVMENGVNVCQQLSSIPVLRYYKVFNAEDIEGIDFKLPKLEPRSEFERIATAEAIIQNYPDPNPKYISVDQDQAYYVPGTDQLNMPPESFFSIDQQYYSTFFHELIHSTGAKKRLDRDMSGGFGSKSYSFEELIAELGATFLCGESGILFFTLNNSAAYLKSWKKRLVESMKKDNKFFFKAAGKAQAAADFILQRDNDGVPKYLSTIKDHLKVKPVKKAAESKTSSIPDAEVKRGILFTTSGSNRTNKAIKAMFPGAFSIAASLGSKRRRWNADFTGSIESVIQKLKQIGATNIKVQGNETKPKAKTMAGPTPDPVPVAEPALPPAPAAQPSELSDKLKTLGVQTGSDILNTNFETLPFDGPWGDFMQTPGANLKVVIYGRPKNGKTTFAFQFADYLSGFHPVLYVLADQGITEATKKLITEMKVGGNDLLYYQAFRDIPTLKKFLDSGLFKIVFIDLINNFQITAKEMEQVFHDYPDTAFILVMESTKGGDFRGEQKWTHIVDAIVRVENWVAYNTGRYGSGEYAWPKPENINI